MLLHYNLYLYDEHGAKTMSMSQIWLNYCIGIEYIEINHLLILYSVLLFDETISSRQLFQNATQSKYEHFEGSSYLNQ